MPKTKKPTIYYNPENPLEISFEKKDGYKRATEKAPVSFTCFLLENAEQVIGASRAVEMCRDTYCLAWDGKSGALAYTDPDVEGQNWYDLRQK